LFLFWLWLLGMFCLFCCSAANNMLRIYMCDAHTKKVHGQCTLPKPKLSNMCCMLLGLGVGMAHCTAPCLEEHHGT
jgi:hypothetical protein